jgi:uncharacterized protein (DUF2147 family)
MLRQAGLVSLVAVALATASIQPAISEEIGSAHATASAPIDVDVLEGVWSRPDGGYTIAIKSVGPDGRLEAMYFNPDPLPFERARASKQGTTIRADFELQAGGYAGSTYELTYDPASDRLEGTYYQAVAKQKYEVFFTRQPVAIR